MQKWTLTCLLMWYVSHDNLLAHIANNGNILVLVVFMRMPILISGTVCFAAVIHVFKCGFFNSLSRN